MKFLSIFLAIFMLSATWLSTNAFAEEGSTSKTTQADAEKGETDGKDKKKKAGEEEPECD